MSILSLSLSLSLYIYIYTVPTDFIGFATDPPHLQAPAIAVWIAHHLFRPPRRPKVTPKDDQREPKGTLSEPLGSIGAPKVAQF